jgi:acyl-CoA dehydrogenase
MESVAALLRETAERLFTRAITPAVLRLADSGGWPDAAWAAVEAAGLARALAAEEDGVPIADALGLLRVAGAHAVPLPLAETMLAGWLLTAAGLSVPDGPLTVAPVVAEERLHLRRAGSAWHLSGRASRVPWARHAVAAAVLAEHAGAPHVVLLHAGDWRSAPGANLAGEPRDTVEIVGTDIAAADRVAPLGLPGEALFAMGAVARAQQIAGALHALTAMTTTYAQERSQFGRPIGRFQAVQQTLAVLAAQAAAAAAAADLGAEAAAEGLRPALIAAAKARAGEAAGIGAAIAHQVHGAIGFTQEHRLHVLTRRLWSWRDEFGNEAVWQRRLGAQMLAAGADGLWAALTAT